MPGTIRGVDRQCGRRAHRQQRAESGRPGLLHHLDARPTAHEQPEAVRRNGTSGEHHRPDDLVDGVVSADVLTHQRHAAVGVERRGPVHGTRLLEQRLRRRDPLRHAHEHVEADRFVRRKWVESRAQLVELIAATPATARRHVAEARCRRRRPTAGLDGDRVVVVRVGAFGGGQVGAVLDRRDRSIREQPFGEAEPDREFVVVARRAHRGRHERAVEADRHRLLDDQPIGEAALDTVVTDAGHPRRQHPFHTSSCHGRHSTCGSPETGTLP